MTYTEKKSCATCAEKPITAEQIINDLVREADDMAYFSENLHEMFLAFVLFHDCLDPIFKADVMHAYTSLRKHLQNVDKLQKERSL